MDDFISHNSGFTLTIGVRNGGVVFGVSDKSGRVMHVTLNGSAAERAAKWLTETSSTLPRASGAELLRAANAALTALVEDKFVRHTSKEMYDFGFDCDKDNCEYAHGDGWCAIYEPDVCELEVYVVHPDLGMTDAARVSVATGAVMPL